MRKKNADYARWQKVIIALLSFLVFSIVGTLAWATLQPITLLPVAELLKDVAPPVLCIGVPAGLLGYRYPKVFSIILCFIPLPGAS